MVIFGFFQDLFNRKKSKKKKSPKLTAKSVPRRTKKKVKKKFRKRVQKRIKKKITKKKIKKIPRKILKKKKSIKPSKKPKETKEKGIGVVTHYFRKISVGAIKLKSSLKVGDKIHIKGAHDDFTQTVTSMQFNHKDILTARKGLEVGIKVIQRVHENDKVYRVAEE